MSLEGERDIPIKESSNHQSSPCHALRFFALHIISNVDLALVYRHRLRGLQLRDIGAKFRKDQPLDAGLNSYVDDSFMGCNLSDRGHINHSILVFEGRKKLGFRVAVGDPVNLDVGGECRGGRFAGEDGDGEVWVGVEG